MDGGDGSFRVGKSTLLHTAGGLEKVTSGQVLVRTASDTPNPMLPVIMLSGHTEPKRVAEARDAGVTDFLSKPVSPKALYLRIEQVILRPRQFVRAKAFEGPDRRRHRDDKYSGRRRRQADDPTIAPATVITPDADE